MCAFRQVWASEVSSGGGSLKGSIKGPCEDFGCPMAFVSLVWRAIGFKLVGFFKDDSLLLLSLCVVMVLLCYF